MFFLILTFSLLMTCVFWGLFAMTIVASWKTHAKAGLEGWTGIVPFYNYYVRAEKANCVNIFWNILKFFGVMFAVGLIGSIVITGLAIATALFQKTYLFMFLIAMIIITTGATFILALTALVQIIRIDIRFIANFEKGKWFAVGMFFFPYIFYPILAWSENITWHDLVYINTEKPTEQQETVEQQNTVE